MDGLMNQNGRWYGVRGWHVRSTDTYGFHTRHSMLSKKYAPAHTFRPFALLKRILSS